MAQSLALPTFRTGADDTLASVDIYKIKTDNVVNSITSIASKYDSELAQSFVGMDKLSVADITSQVTNNASSLMDAGALTRMSGLGSNVSNAIRSLDSSLRSGIGSLSGMSSLIPNMGSFNIGGVTSMIGGNNIGQALSMGNLINGLTGSTSGVFNLVDNLASSSLYSNVLGKCFDMGIGGVTQTILTTVASKQVLTAVASTILPTIIRKSSTKDLLGLATILGGNNVNRMYPSVYSDYGKCYANDTSDYGLNYGNEYAGVMGAYSAIDNNYNQTNRGGGLISSIANLVGGNSNYANMLRYGGMQTGNTNNSKLAIVASILGVNTNHYSVQNSLTNRYRRTNFTFNNQVNTQSNPLIMY